jgi:hypothetical protein
MLMTNAPYNKDPVTQKSTLLEGLHYIPNFPFCRIIYVFTRNCGWDRCLHSQEDISQELFDCLKSVYWHAIVLFVMAVYLNEVLPQ